MLLAPSKDVLPAAQFTQLVAEVVVENLATGQFKQPEPVVEYLPAAHAPHAARLMAPVVDPVPALQSVQIAALFVFENLPGIQEIHLLYKKRPRKPLAATM
jgi:hypothetical protein